ncbi:hypothetical protein [Peribacillus alkalitolerans]|uniref:hypothetical protein n=1 Tax=Peribacillus alkalitolerans TaxID=1550385 RepID=UPI0013D52E73|nr:hypothetical protein [Peribacillus alkalitolerans]
MYEKKELQVGKIKIHFPNPTYKKFWFYADVAEFLQKETTEDAIRIIKKELKEMKGFKSISFDSESDGASFSHKSGEKVLEVAILINKLSDSSYEVDENIKDEIIKEIKTYKIPKGQEWNIGDIFAIPVESDQSYYAGQIIDYNEDFGVVCIFFTKEFEDINDIKLTNNSDFNRENVFAAMCFSDEYLSDFTFKIIRNDVKLTANVAYTSRRNKLAVQIMTDLCVLNLMEMYKEGIEDQLVKESKEKLKYLI